MPTVRATLGGYPLAAIEDVGWTFQPGVRAHYRTFQSDAATVQAIYDKGGPLTLEIEAPGYQPLHVEHLYPLSTQPGTTPHTMGIRVADRRVLLTHRFICRDYNMRRRTGETRLVVEGTFENNIRVAPDISYWPTTLFVDTPWTAEEMLEDVLIRSGLPYVMPPQFARRVEVEDLELRGRYDRMLGHALSYLGGYECWLDAEGTLWVYDTYDGVAGVNNDDRQQGGEKGEATWSPWGPVIVGTGYIQVAQRRWIRPKKISVGFTEECEIRFDYVEGEHAGASTYPVLSTMRPPRRLENVMPSPDIDLTVHDPAGQRPSRRVGQGSWITFDEAFASWPLSSYPKPSTATKNIGHDVLREHWLRNFSDVAKLYGGQAVPEPVWLDRIAACRRHWRQTFRISRPWRDKFYSVRSMRAVLMDVENGIRAASLVYSDWLVKADLHTYARKKSEYLQCGWQVTGYADLLSDAKAAPAAVIVKDEEQGVIHFALHTDPAGQAHEVAFGRLDVGKDLPRTDFSAAEAFWGKSTLRKDWSAATVLTVIRAAPNDSGRLHWEEVTPQQAEVVLGHSPGQCDGPEVEIHVTGGRLTARFGWDDGRAGTIENAFIFGFQLPKTLLSNTHEVRHVALAEAARYYAMYQDRLEGSCAVPWNPEIKIEGSMSSVTHTIGTDGRAATWVVLAPKLEPLDTQSLLPQSVQRVMRRMVQP